MGIFQRFRPYLEFLTHLLLWVPKLIHDVRYSHGKPLIGGIKKIKKYVKKHNSVKNINGKKT